MGRQWASRRDALLSPSILHSLALFRFSIHSKSDELNYAQPVSSKIRVLTLQGYGVLGCSLLGLNPIEATMSTVLTGRNDSAAEIWRVQKSKVHN